MKILVTGVKGQLGCSIANYLGKNSYTFVGADKEQFDITNKSDTISYIKHIKPDAIVHCGAYSNVDHAEEEPELCIETNSEGTKNIAIASLEVGAKLLYISSDYVFDGKKETPYDPDDKPNPLSVYGRSKAMGEENVRQFLDKYFIVRISWLFGEKDGPNFVEKMLRLGKKNDKLNVVKDQVGSPTYTEDVVPLLIAILKSEKYGIYHVTNEGFCSWAEFAREIMNAATLACKILPVFSNEYPTMAVRPKNSMLSKDKLSKSGFERLPPWKDALHRYLDTREERGEQSCN